MSDIRNVSHQTEEQAKAAKHQAVEFEKPPGKERKCPEEWISCVIPKRRDSWYSQRDLQCVGLPPLPPLLPQVARPCQADGWEAHHNAKISIRG